MSQLEMHVQPIVLPMLIGESCQLSLGAQLLVSQWAVKMAMVLDALSDQTRHAYTFRERERLRRVSAVPTKTVVWLAASADPAVFMTGKNRHLTEAESTTPSGTATTIALSSLVFQVFTVRLPPHVADNAQITVNVRKAPWQEITARVWPTQPGACWPTAIALNGVEDLDMFAGRFGTLDLAESEIGLMIL